MEDIVIEGVTTDVSIKFINNQVHVNFKQADVTYTQSG